MKENPIVFIYKVENKVNGMKYIGHTSIDPDERWKNHIKNSESSITLISNAIKEYGSDNFSFEILAITNFSEYEEIKIKLITEFSSISPTGYNVLLEMNYVPISKQLMDKMIGLAGNKGISIEETRRKMSNSAKKRPSHNLGKPMSSEQKEKLRKANTLFSEEKSKEISNKYKLSPNVEALSKEYNCSTSAIYTALKNNNIKIINGAQISEAQEIEIINYYTKDKLSLRKISKFYKCDSSKIKKILLKHNIKITVSGPTAKTSLEIQNEIKEKSKQGIKLSKLVKMYNISQVTVSKILRGDY